MPPTAAVILVSALALTLVQARAQEETPNPDVPQSALETKLAYVITGNADVDAISKAGLAGLTLFLAQRTALEPGDPIGLDIAHDELAFYPLIYWPIVPGAPRPSDDALKRIDTYMKDGGTVLFDTRDAVVAPPGPDGETNSPGMLELRKILSSLDIPELEPVPRDHVLTKTFYLLRDFPGRFDTGQLWVEALPATSEEETSSRPARGGDGVSSILITSNDFAGAWATQSDGQPMLPMVEGEPRQREMAFRAGVNIVMYTLTGNYKADQVHVPALLERLGSIGERIESRRCVRSSHQRSRIMGGDCRRVPVFSDAFRVAQPRRRDPDAGARFDRARARQSVAHPRASRSAELGRRRRRRQESEPKFRRPHPADRSRARCGGRAAAPHSRP